MKKFVVYLLILCTPLILVSEEGMWPFNRIPIKNIQEKYEATLSPKMIDHIQKSCVRIRGGGVGGSGSFVSSEGLLVTNHHVAASTIYNLSSEEKNLMDQGFYARERGSEIPCPNIYVDVLQIIEDVTEEVNTGVEEINLSKREEKRQSNIQHIKERKRNETGLEAEVVALYQGARYHLYLYKRYIDVRLVMAPEKDIASFGGDEDNFEFPRYSLDIAFFRVYENNRPLRSHHYLKWNQRGPQGRELLFVAGHPGRTDRMCTSEHLKFIRDREFPLYLTILQEKLRILDLFSQESEEKARIALPSIHSCQNSLKVIKGALNALKEEGIIERKQKEEQTLLQDNNKDAWEQLHSMFDEADAYYPTFFMCEGVGSSFSKLFTIARHLVRLSTERKKPSDERLKEYADTELPTLELTLLSTEPFYLDLEETLMTCYLELLQKVLGKDHEGVKALLQGKLPSERSRDVMRMTKLKDINERRRLYERPEQVVYSDDPLILFVKALDPIARRVRQTKEEKMDSLKKESYQKIGNILFERYGESVYPDATFTLRLSIGEMQGYKEKKKLVRPITTLGNIYAYAEKHQDNKDFLLPLRWKEKEEILKNNEIPFNFVSTHDIIGGNSGSPVINTRGEFVGVIFDGNSHTMPWNFEYNEKNGGRAISVHSCGILKALKVVYRARALVTELQRGHP